MVLIGIYKYNSKVLNVLFCYSSNRNKLLNDIMLIYIRPVFFFRIIVLYINTKLHQTPNMPQYWHFFEYTNDVYPVDDSFFKLMIKCNRRTSFVTDERRLHFILNLSSYKQLCSDFLQGSSVQESISDMTNLTLSYANEELSSSLRETSSSTSDTSSSSFNLSSSTSTATILFSSDTISSHSEQPTDLTQETSTGCNHFFQNGKSKCTLYKRIETHKIRMLLTIYVHITFFCVYLMHTNICITHNNLGTCR